MRNSNLLLPKLKKMIISCLYRSPSSTVNMFTEQVESLMYGICTNKTVFIVGDINIDMLNSKNVHYINLINSFGLLESHSQVKHVLIQYIQIQPQ